MRKDNWRALVGIFDDIKLFPMQEEIIEQMPEYGYPPFTKETVKDLMESYKNGFITRTELISYFPSSMDAESIIEDDEPIQNRFEILDL